MAAGIRYLSVCSGIEAATVAWRPLGWEAAAFSEIEAFPRAVLAHHYPDTPCHGDFTTIGADEYGPINLLVGGTPCQSFSVAGLRGGLADDRGNLALEYLRLAQRKRPVWLVWENVPGVLSSNGGRDFGSILGGLVELGYGFAYRVLDAQFFGVPQRRRRVFVVGYLGDWRRAAAVLFERHSLQGNTAPRREKGQDSSERLGFSTVGSLSGGYGSKLGTDESCQGSVIPDWPAEICPTLDTYYGDKLGLEDQHIYNQKGGKFVPVAIQSVNTPREKKQNGIGVSESGQMYSLTARDQRAVCFTQNSRDEVRHIGGDGQIAGALAAEPGMKQTNYVAIPYDFFNITAPVNRQNRKDGDPCHTLARDNASHATIQTSSAVRRLTPRECERLQGFPDDYTAVPYRGKPAADGPRYKALGNSMAVPVMRWIGERIQMVEALQSQAEAA